ncbi:hypothetical protein HC024_15695 [Methylococcaceae bacterium WWC4]|nr:hypothetical protein [Methylococcaceae bacterium WWC4]
MKRMNKAKISMVTMAAFSSVLAVSDASATACVSGVANSSATITMNVSNLALMGTPIVTPTFTCGTAVGSRCLYVDKVLTDGQFTYDTPGFNTNCMDIYQGAHAAYSPANLLCNDSPVLSPRTTNLQEAQHGSLLWTGTPAWTAPSATQTLPGVCTTGYQSANVTTNILYTSGSTVNVGTKIGLAGAYKFRTDVPNSTGYTTNRGYSLRFGRFYLYKSAANTWQLIAKGAGDTNGTTDAVLFQATVTETVTGSGVGGRTVTLPSTSNFKIINGTAAAGFSNFGTFLQSTSTNIRPTNTQLGNTAANISMSVKF